MKKQQGSKTLVVLLFTGCLLTPMQLRAEAEPLYVSGFDLDSIESNDLLSWVEEVRYRLSEASPCFRNMLEPNDNLAGDR
ncbi:MAG: hypothetical protein KAH00_01345 [Cocleimonas sp.]|nr:hypothetical protein [Cocleimonas sp.]